MYGGFYFIHMEREFCIITNIQHDAAKKIIFDNKAKIIAHKKYNGENAYRILCEGIGCCLHICLSLAAYSEDSIFVTI